MGTSTETHTTKRVHAIDPATARRSSKDRERTTFWLLVGPAVALYAIMMLFPLFRMFYVSMLDWRVLVRPGVFDGLANYRSLFASQDFYDALRNTAVHVGVALPLSIFPAFFLGFWLTRLEGKVGRRRAVLLRIIFFSPAMISPPGRALIFLGLYFPDGILNQFLMAIGLENLVHVWLHDPTTSLGAVLAINIWGGIGFFAVLFYAVLNNIPTSLFEAARVEGVTDWGIMRRIAFPLIINFVGVALMLHFLFLLLGSAQTILLLTRGGPGTSSTTLGYFLYEQAFEMKNLGFSQAIAVVILFIGVAGMLIIRRLTNRVYEF